MGRGLGVGVGVFKNRFQVCSCSETNSSGLIPRLQRYSIPPTLPGHSSAMNKSSLQFIFILLPLSRQPPPTTTITTSNTPTNTSPSTTFAATIPPPARFKTPPSSPPCRPIATTSPASDCRPLRQRPSLRRPKSSTKTANTIAPCSPPTSPAAAFSTTPTSPSPSFTISSSANATSATAPPLHRLVPPKPDELKLALEETRELDFTSPAFGAWLDEQSHLRHPRRNPHHLWPPRRAGRRRSFEMGLAARPRQNQRRLSFHRRRLRQLQPIIRRHHARQPRPRPLPHRRLGQHPKKIASPIPATPNPSSTPKASAGFPWTPITISSAMNPPNSSPRPWATKMPFFYPCPAVAPGPLRSKAPSFILPAPMPLRKAGFKPNSPKNLPGKHCLGEHTRLCPSGKTVC